MPETDFYQVLGVAPSAVSDEIREAWRHRVRHVHPDAGGDAGAFHQVHEAYETLSNPRRRALYDAVRAGELAEAWDWFDEGVDHRPRHAANGRGRHRSGTPWRKRAGQVAGLSRRARALFQRDEVLEAPLDDDLPWYAGIDSSRSITVTPAVRHWVGLFAGAVLGWLALTLWLGQVAMAASMGAVLPYFTFAGCFVMVLCVRGVRTEEGRRLAWFAAGTVGVAALSAVALTGGSLIGFAVAVHLGGNAAIPALASMIRGILAIHRDAPRGTLDFNAFGPPGRPRADARVAALLRELLATLPGARLFVRLPVRGQARPVEYTLLCGKRMAVIGRSFGRTDPSVLGINDLDHAVSLLSELTPAVRVRGFALHATAVSDTTGLADAIAIANAAEAIGSWLAADPYTVDLPTVLTLRGQYGRRLGQAARTAPGHVLLTRLRYAMTSLPITGALPGGARESESTA